MPDAVASRARVSDVRRFWRTVLEPPGLLRRLEPAYYVLITLVIAGPFIYGTAREALAEVATPRALETWGPSIALVGLLALVRWGAVQGPVVFSVADVAQLLGAPLRRAELVLGRLLRGMLAAAAAGAVAGALVVVGVAGHDRGVAGGRAADLIVSAALLALLGIAGASLVQGSARWDRATRLARWPVMAVAVGLVILASSGPTGRDIAVWSGPWGWAIGPLVGRSALATVLLAAVAALAVVGALARRGMGSTERHLVRAEAREGAVAAVYSMNARYVGRSFASVGSRPGTTAGRTLRMPRTPRLAIAWRDAVAALNAPGRLGEALVLATAGCAICLVNADHPAAVAGGSLVVYLGASRLLEPLRAETDKPSRVRVLLRKPQGKVMAEHALVPGAVVLAGAVLAVAGCAIAGELPSHGATAALLAVVATPAITMCAALSGRRGGQLPQSVMAVTYGDTTGMSSLILIAWIVAFPVLAIALDAVPVSLAAEHGTQVLFGCLALLGSVSAVLAIALGWERQPA